MPSGPYTADQIGLMLGTGEAAWDTPACPVGGSTWLPLGRTPGIGLAATDPAVDPHTSLAPNTQPVAQSVQRPARHEMALRRLTDLPECRHRRRAELAAGTKFKDGKPGDTVPTG